jgi:hypothetical protein
MHAPHAVAGVQKAVEHDEFNGMPRLQNIDGRANRF